MENTILTRYQLVRVFIRVIALAFIVVWYFNMGRSLYLVSLYLVSLYLVKTYGTEGYGGNIFLEILLTPLLVLMCWPLHSVLARDMVGSGAEEPLTSTRDLKSLFWPAIGAILIFQSLVRIAYDTARLWDMIAQLNRNNDYTGGFLASMLVSNEYSLMDWIFIDGHRFLVDLILLFVGFLAIRTGVLRSRSSVGTQAQTLLTRFQLASNYIYLVIISFLIYWVLNISLLQFQYLSGVGAGSSRTIVAISPVFNLFPFSVLLMLPFSALLANAMCGDESQESVHSPQQLRALFLPCVGFAVLVWSLSGVSADLVRAYTEFFQTPVPPAPIWDWAWRTLTFPIFKLSLGVIWVIYPSVRDMIRQTMRRTT